MDRQELIAYALIAAFTAMGVIVLWYAIIASRAAHRDWQEHRP